MAAPDMSWKRVAVQHDASVVAAQQLELRRARTAAFTEHVEGVVFEVDEPDKLDSVAWEKQADSTMHTLEAWEKRFALRRHAQVREVLHNGWWMTALRTLQAQSPEAESPILDKTSYTRIYKLLFRALARTAKEKYIEAEAQECAEEDWAADSRDGVSMPRELFMDALFQIADLYTDEADAYEYAAFLKKILHACIAKGTEVATKDSVFWKTKQPQKPKGGEAVVVPSPPPTPVVPVVPDVSENRNDSPPPAPKQGGKKSKVGAGSSASPPRSRGSGVGAGAGGGGHSASKGNGDAEFVAEAINKVDRNSDAWLSGGGGNDVLGLQYGRMDWRDVEQLPPEKRLQYDAWASSGGAKSLDGKIEAVDWGDREVVKEEVRPPHWPAAACCPRCATAVLTILSRALLAPRALRSHSSSNHPGAANAKRCVGITGLARQLSRYSRKYAACTINQISRLPRWRPR